MKPILFNTDMVRAILDGRKTVTRRVVKPHNSVKANRFEYRQGNGLWVDDTHIKDYSVSPCWIDIQSYIQKYAPYAPGDILYLRETWRKDVGRYMYKADYSDGEKFYRDGKEVSIKWRTSIHMPREVARIFLRVTDVRVERLHDITPEQAMKEGVVSKENRPFIMYEQVGQIEAYARNKIFPNVWDSTIQKSDRAIYGWDANPWVWVIEFERCEKPEEA